MNNPEQKYTYTFTQQEADDLAEALYHIREYIKFKIRGKLPNTVLSREQIRNLRDFSARTEQLSFRIALDGIDAS